MGFFVFGIVMAVVLTIVLSIRASQDCKWHNIVAVSMASILGLAFVVTIIWFCFTD